MAKSSAHKNSNMVWNFFSSVKLTLVLLIILAIASLFGTLIPQQEGAVEFARGISPGMFQLLSSLNLFDMYHSSWFRIIIGLLALNLIVCSVNRLPATLKLFRAPPPERIGPNPLKIFPLIGTSLSRERWMRRENVCLTF